MHISYRHDTPDVVVNDDSEISLIYKGLLELKDRQVEAMNVVNRSLPITMRPFDIADFGIDKLTSMLNVLNEVL